MLLFDSIINFSAKKNGKSITYSQIYRINEWWHASAITYENYRFRVSINISLERNLYLEVLINISLERNLNLEVLIKELRMKLR